MGVPTMPKLKNDGLDKFFSGGSAGPEILLDNEIESLKQQALDHSIRDYTMISLALATGIRNHELVSLTMFCVYYDGNVLNELELPKTMAKGGRNRSIPLHPDIKVDLNVFILWKTGRQESISPGSPLFCSKYSKKQLSERDFQRITSIHSIDAIGRSIHPHIFRHTFATKLLKKSNLAVVKKALGHASISTTQIYTHPSREDLSKAIYKM